MHNPLYTTQALLRNSLATIIIKYIYIYIRKVYKQITDDNKQYNELKCLVGYRFNWMQL